MSRACATGAPRGARVRPARSSRGPRGPRPAARARPATALAGRTDGEEAGRDQQRQPRPRDRRARPDDPQRPLSAGQARSAPWIRSDGDGVGGLAQMLRSTRRGAGQLERTSPVAWGSAASAWADLPTRQAYPSRFAHHGHRSQLVQAVHPSRAIGDAAAPVLHVAHQRRQPLAPQGLGLRGVEHVEVGGDRIRRIAAVLVDPPAAGPGLGRAPPRQLGVGRANAAAKAPRRRSTAREDPPARPRATRSRAPQPPRTGGDGGRARQPAAKSHARAGSMGRRCRSPRSSKVDMMRWLVPRPTTSAPVTTGHRIAARAPRSTSSAPRGGPHGPGR